MSWERIRKVIHRQREGPSEIVTFYDHFVFSFDRRDQSVWYLGHSQNLWTAKPKKIGRVIDTPTVALQLAIETIMFPYVELMLLPPSSRPNPRRRRR